MRRNEFSEDSGLTRFYANYIRRGRIHDHSSGRVIHRMMAILTIPVLITIYSFYAKSRIPKIEQDFAGKIMSDTAIWCGTEKSKGWENYHKTFTPSLGCVNSDINYDGKLESVLFAYDSGQFYQKELTVENQTWKLKNMDSSTSQAIEFSYTPQIPAGVNLGSKDYIWCGPENFKERKFNPPKFSCFNTLQADDTYSDALVKMPDNQVYNAKDLVEILKEKSE
ncbi:MAG: hypothetical protein Q8O89_08715 [Nanoarchaeota archaeon]|nr:hypothetical protein [Nanoarchaeota archaeon]